MVQPIFGRPLAGVTRKRGSRTGASASRSPRRSIAPTWRASLTTATPRRPFGFVSPANTIWHNNDLKYPHESVADANRMLAASGFHRSGNRLYDSAGHPVKFSILTNAGNAARQKMAAMIQQDLAATGMQVIDRLSGFPRAD